MALKTCYTFAVKGSRMQPMADLSYDQVAPRQWWIHRINVPAEIRGQGHGSELLRLITEDADESMVTLRLEILSSGPLSHEDLQAWYRRYGFEPDSWDIYVRRPLPPPSAH